MTEVVADAYATMAEFRLFLRNSAANDAADPDYLIEQNALEAARRAIDVFANRRFDVAAASSSARVFGPPMRVISTADWSYPVIGRQHGIIEIDDLADGTTITEVAFDYVGDGDFDTTTTAYRVGPTNNAALGLPYTRLIFDLGTWPPNMEEGVKVTAKWGWTAIPSAIKNANLIQAKRLILRKDAPFGIAGSPDLAGSDAFRLLPKLDPDVQLLVSGYRRNWGAV